jgi:hypothetical protein
MQLQLKQAIIRMEKCISTCTHKEHLILMGKWIDVSLTPDYFHSEDPIWLEIEKDRLYDLIRKHSCYEVKIDQSCLS